MFSDVWGGTSLISLSFEGSPSFEDLQGLPLITDLQAVNKTDYLHAHNYHINAYLEHAINKTLNPPSYLSDNNISPTDKCSILVPQSQ